MRSTIPLSRVTERISFPIRSSDGKSAWTVIVYESGMSCTSTNGPCPGFRFRGTCRHVRTCRTWLEAVIPPQELPS